MNRLRLNRTFMELKCRQRDFPMLDVDSLNRTFMELKLHFMAFCGVANVSVLIVPLWN